MAKRVALRRWCRRCACSPPLGAPWCAAATPAASTSVGRANRARPTLAGWS